MSSSATLELVAARPFSIAVRADLTFQPMEFQGRRCWNVKDPLTLRYFQLNEEEAFLLQHLDGARSLTELQQLFERRFAPRRVSLEQLHGFVGLLHREGLTVSHAFGQGEELLQRHRQAVSQRRRQALANVLAIRLRGFDPEPLLQWLYPKLSWAFTRQAWAFGATFILVAVLLVLLHFDTFLSRLPHVQDFFTPTNVLWLAVVLAGCKVLHELGHALTCKHFGGECHELGLMFLVFTPCLYCNVSDAWLLRDKWQRIAVSAAGIWVELQLAAAATFLWWFSQPGLLNSLCLNVMFVCSVSTLLLNGNPLLRYDGYFILADLVEVPNLRQQADSALREWLLAWWCGIEPQVTALLSVRARLTLVAYAIASLAYRWLLLVGILLLAYEALRPNRLQVLAQFLGVLVVAGMMAGPLGQAARAWRDPRQWRRIRRRRLAWASLVLAAALAGLWFLPVRDDVMAPVVLEPAEASRVYATVEGRLVEQVSPGQVVAPGDLLVRLDNAEVDRQVVALEGERDTQSLDVKQLQLLQVRDSHTGPAAAGSRLLTAVEALKATEKQLEQLRSDQSQLRITAPRAGVVLPPRAVMDADAADEDLQSWTGSPLERCNLGSFLEAGTLVCWIGAPDRLQGLVVIEQADIERIEVGQRASLLLDELHQQVLEGEVTDVARLELDDLPPELTAKRLLTRDQSTSSLPGVTYYVARVSLPPLTLVPPLWSSGSAKIHVPPRPLGRILYEYVCDTFRIDL